MFFIWRQLGFIYSVLLKNIFQQMNWVTELWNAIFFFFLLTLSLILWMICKRLLRFCSKRGLSNMFWAASPSSEKCEFYKVRECLSLRYCSEEEHGLWASRAWINIMEFTAPHSSQLLSVRETVSDSVVSNSLWPHGLQPARLLCPWNSPGKKGMANHSRYSWLENSKDKGAW